MAYPTLTARIAATLASATLLAAAMNREAVAGVGGVALVLWLGAVTSGSWARAAILGTTLGLVYGMLVSLWMPMALRMLDASGAASIAGHVAACAWSGPPVFVAIALVACATEQSSATFRAAALAAAAFSAESLVATSWWGVPWGLLGYGQRGLPGVAQLAVVAGVPGISALLVALNSALADTWRRRPGAGRLATALACGWLSLALLGLPLAETLRPRPPASAAETLLVVRPNLPRGERWIDRLQTLNLGRVRRSVERALERERPGIDAIVLPENVFTTPLESGRGLARALDAWVDELGLPVLTGLVLAPESASPHLYRSAAVWLEPGRGLAARLDKERAIPLLESSRQFPGSLWLASLFGSAAQWPKVEEAQVSKPFAGPIPVTPVLCYEVLFSSLVAERHTATSLALLNLADDSWLGGDAASRHLADIARFRAIERRATLIRVAHRAPVVVIDPFGRVTHTLPLGRETALRVPLRPSPPPAAAERAALLALPLGAGLLVWWTGSRRGRAARGPRAGAEGGGP